MNLKTDLKYKNIYEEILKEIEKHNYSVFEGEKDTKINPILKHNPFSDEEQKISLISKELLIDDLNEDYSKFKYFESFSNSGNYLFFELTLNGFKEKHQVLKNIDVYLLKCKMLNDGIFIDFYKNALIIGLRKDLL